MFKFEPPAPTPVDLVFAWRCMALGAITKTGMLGAVKLAEAMHAPDRSLRMLKGAVASADFGQSNDVRTAMGAYFDAEAKFGAAAKLFASGFQRVPLRTPIAITTASALGSETAEGSYKAISRFVLGSNTGIARRKVSTIIVVTEQALRDLSATGQRFVSEQLLLGTAGALDAAVFGDLAAGAVDVNPLTGGTFGDNLSALFEAFPPTKQTSKLVLVVTPSVAKEVTGLQGQNGALYPKMSCTGGQIGMLEVMVSESLVAIAVDALLLDANAVGGDVEPDRFDAARHASVAMDDAPSDGPQSMTSLWQVNAAALRIERWFGLEELRPCCAKMVGIL